MLDVRGFCRPCRLTSNAGKELAGKALNLAVREGDESVALEKIKDALTEEIHDYADVASVIEAIPQVNTAIPILLIVGLKSSKYSQFYSGSIAVLLYRANNFDSDLFVASPIVGLYYLAEGTLAEKTSNLVCIVSG